MKSWDKAYLVGDGPLLVYSSVPLLSTDKHIHSNEATQNTTEKKI